MSISRLFLFVYGIFILFGEGGGIELSCAAKEVNVYGAWDSPEIVSSIAVRLFAETPLQKSIDSINYF